MLLFITAMGSIAMDLFDQSTASRYFLVSVFLNDLTRDSIPAEETSDKGSLSNSLKAVGQC